MHGCVYVDETAAELSMLCGFDDDLAAQLELILAQHSKAEQQILDLVEAHPLSAVIRSIPGVGMRTKAL